MKVYQDKVEIIEEPVMKGKKFKRSLCNVSRNHIHGYSYYVLFSPKDVKVYQDQVEHRRADLGKSKLKSIYDVCRNHIHKQDQEEQKLYMHVWHKAQQLLYVKSNLKLRNQ